MIRRRLIFVLPVLLLLLLPWPTIAAQYNYIDISNPFLRKTPIAVPMFKASAQDPAAMAVARAASAAAWNIILDFTGYFTFSDPAAFLEDPQTMNLTGSGIRYRNWTVIGAELLVTGSVVIRDGDAEFELRLFDTVKEKMLVGKRYRGSADDHSQVARRFGSEVVFAITGSRGFFDSKIAFVSNGSGHKEILPVRI
jgi:TolB protein